MVRLIRFELLTSCLSSKRSKPAELKPRFVWFAKINKRRVTYSFQNAIQTLAHKPDIMHAQDYVDYMLLSGAAKESDFAFWDGKTDTDWAQ